MRELSRLGKEGWHGRVLADRFWPVWTQMFFSARPWDWAVGGKWSRARWTSQAGSSRSGWISIRLSVCLPAMRKVLSASRYGGQEVAASGLLAASHRVDRPGAAHQLPGHGILQAAVPWARPGSGFTLMMEAMILLLGQQMSVSAAARHLGESDKRLWRVLEHYVMEAHAAKDWSQVRRLMIDETSARKGHRYGTVVLDAESHALLLMVEGRSAQAVTEFLAAMPAHPAKAEAITEVVMDMSPAYIAGVQAHFPNARIVFDLFHIMKLAGEALDAVRKSLRKQGADLTGGLWALRGTNGRAPRNNSTCAASWPAPTRSWAAPWPCVRLSKGCWPMATCLPSAGGWAGPTVPGSNLFANSPELSKNTSTAFWPISTLA